MFSTIKYINIWYHTESKFLLYYSTKFHNIENYFCAYYSTVQYITVHKMAVKYKKVQ